MSRTNDPAAQQASISEAVWRVMSASGPQQLTLRAVAAEAGCSTGLVLHRFPNKRALLIHARRMLDERTTQRMAAVEAEELDPAKGLEEVVLGSILGAEFDARIWLGFLAAAVSDSELSDVQNSANENYLDTVERLLRAAKPDWDAPRRRTTAITLVGLSTGLAALATVAEHNYSRLEQKRAIQSTISALLGATVSSTT